MLVRLKIFEKYQVYGIEIGGAEYDLYTVSKDSYSSLI
jgi:hypothetical protein